MSPKNEALFWKKKEFVSFLLSILVFFIHSYFAPEITSDRFISILNHKVSFFFSRSITQFAVPTFFLLSGITFFKGYTNQKYLTKIKSRLHSLVLPYLLWNTVWMLWGLVSSRAFSAVSLADIFKGVFFYGYYQPFWFLFNLIVFSLAAPLVFCIIRNKAVGIGAIVFLTVASDFGIHLPESIFYYPTSIVFYLIGAMIGCHGFDFLAKKSSKPMQLASCAFLFLYILAKNIVPQPLQITSYIIQIVVFSLCGYALWNVLDLFVERIKPRALYRHSFAIYAMHLNVAIAILNLLSRFLPQSEWTEIPKFLVMVVATLVIIRFSCAFLEKYFPKLSALLFGNRVKPVRRKPD